MGQVTVACVIGLVRVFGEGVEKSRVKFWGFFFGFSWLAGEELLLMELGGVVEAVMLLVDGNS